MSDDKGFQVTDRRFWNRSDEDGGEPSASAPTYVGKLEEMIRERDDKLRRVAEQVRAIEHEYEEARARLRKEVAVESERSRRALLGELLEVIDNLDRSIAAARGPEHFEALLAGIKMVRGQFLATLGGLGVTPFRSEGQPFDPTLHAAASAVPVLDPAQDGLIVGVIKEGYKIGQDVLRPATVAVGKLSS